MKYFVALMGFLRGAVNSYGFAVGFMVVLTVILGLLLLVLNIALCGITLFFLWGWFVAPIFNLPFLSIPQGIGLWLFLSFILPIPVPNPNQDEAFGWFIASIILAAIGTPIIVLVIGAVVHSFV